ncbi:glycosyltransferase [Mesorhizobium sp. BAC0120]|uniref:glycosyltransferase n=1 Tax=Mesorhizobium sp. BAC0120 TaxID=3090670 RepID=UPI00298D5DAC|nr:glycosyltransferase [Mesorhizobium sp. BAC0120]MDW6020965.1 glycosyltransferase [Mesorhizobium sp. BAC0120]
MHIVTVVSSLGGGGAERVVIELSQYLCKLGHVVTILTLSGEDPDAYPVPPSIRRERLEIRRPSHSIIDTVWFSLKHLRTMRRRIVGLRPDIVLSFIDQTNVRVIASLLGSGIPVIAAERVDPRYNEVSRAWRVARRLTYPLASAVVVQTESARSWFLKWLPVHKICVLPNAIRSGEFIRTSASELDKTEKRGGTILAVGRLTYQKGHDLLLDAFSRSSLARAGWRVVVLGEGPERAKLLQQAAALGVGDAFSVPGRVSNVGDWLQRADISVLSSRYEGFPNALLEAMQIGRACISFDCPSGPRDLVAHGQSGWLVPAEDVDALAQALQQLAADSDLRRRLGTEAAKVNDRYSQDRIYGLWLRMIEAKALRKPEKLRRYLLKRKRVKAARSKKILFVIGILAVGGAETQLAILAEQLVMRGWAVSVYTLERTGALVDRLESAGIKVIDGGYRHRSVRKIPKLLSLARCEIRLIRHILAIRPNVAHGFLPLTNFMCAIAGRVASVPRIVTSKRGLGRHQDRRPRMKWLDRTANALSHIITANSHAVAEDTVKRDGNKKLPLVVIPNGLDFSRFAESLSSREEVRRQLGIEPTDIAIVKVANLIPYKGHSELIRAFAAIASKRVGLKLFLIGEDRGLGQMLGDEVRRLGMEQRVTFMGSRDDVPALLAAMDVGVMASHEEGFSNALLEKLAAGLPVVATKIGGNPEALDRMPGCELVRPEDPDDLARGMLKVIDGLHEAAPQREERSRRVRERYSVEAMVDAYEHIYQVDTSSIV